MKLNALARELFWFGLEHQITLMVEGDPREENTLADKLSKILIPDDFAVSRTHFWRLELLFGAHAIDLFASGANNLCERIYSLHLSGGANAFAYDRGGEIAWISCPYKMVSRVWIKLQHDEAIATMVIPLWESPTW